MTKLRLILLCALLALTGPPALAALSGNEKRAFDYAATDFGLGIWDRAEIEFAQFIEKYPKSEQLNKAILLQAQSQFRQRKYDSAVALLTAREGDAGPLADQFLFWVAEAQFQNGNYVEAAASFGKLAREFPASNRRLEAAVGEAAARVRMSEWAQVTNLLRRADGAFRQSALGLTNNETVARGYLLLAEAQLALKNYPDAEFWLTKVGNAFSGELDWQRRNLLCRTLVGWGRIEDALRESAGLLTAAEATRQRELLSESIVLRADVLEQLGREEEAVTLLRRNLETNAPAARQEQALAKITSLALEQARYDVAIDTLQSFVNQFPTSGAAPIALLTLGEVYLKQYASVRATNQNNAVPAVATNLLPLAMNCFDRVTTLHSNSVLVGRAHLGRGWCYWLETPPKYSESAKAFDAAVEFLPSSEDLVVARFKLADALFQQKSYAAALENYRAALQTATNWPAANAELRMPALYQSLRASLALTNFPNAEEAVREILQTDPADASNARSLLLVAQGHVDANEPAQAQPWFEQFVAQFPNSEWRPQVELLIARVLEQQSAWTNALAAYENWLTRFPSNALRPQVEFQRALALARSGNESNALNLFTNFVAQYPTNALAPRAQWWVADSLFNRGEFAAAELKFKELFQNWKTSDLANEARMMAGRAAMQWSGYPNAIEYFTSLISDTNCPSDLWIRAVLACGGAKMRVAPAETNRVAGYTAAVQVFGLIPQRFPTNESAAVAWGEMGNGYLQMAALDPANYEAASNAYQKVISLPAASVSARSQALCGLGAISEKLADKAGNDERRALLLRARDLYLDVALEKNLREGETADDFYIKKAAFEALRLLELMQGWSTQDDDTVLYFCRRMQQVLPAIKTRFEAIITRTQNPSQPEKS
ncbi:MAG TPA: tetratricopeptide repeat protein [Verrucomicrobiae bacterium]|nr:tetratricopeptide repeat protein [Verrucomicrobiae bacterium]